MNHIILLLQMMTIKVSTINMILQNRTEPGDWYITRTTHLVGFVFNIEIMENKSKQVVLVIYKSPSLY